jgi:hypothetical protein
VSDDWEASFIAACVTLDVPADVAAASLGGASAARAGEVIRALRAGSRSARAGALATALAPVAMEIDRMDLR